MSKDGLPALSRGSTGSPRGFLCGSGSRLFRRSRNSGMTSAEIHHVRRRAAAVLIPGTWRVWQHMRAACRRRGVMHPTPHMASGRRLEDRSSLEGRDPGGPDGPLAAKRQQCRGNAGRLQWLKVRSRSSGNLERRRKPKQPAGTQIAATRVPEGNPGTVRCGEPDKGSRGGPRGSPGTGASQPRGCRVRHPRYPSHLRPHRRGRTARGRGVSSRMWRMEISSYRGAG